MPPPAGGQSDSGGQSPHRGRDSSPWARSLPARTRRRGQSDSLGRTQSMNLSVDGQPCSTTIICWTASSMMRSFNGSTLCVARSATEISVQTDIIPRVRHVSARKVTWNRQVRTNQLHGSFYYSTCATTISMPPVLDQGAPPPFHYNHTAHHGGPVLIPSLLMAAKRASSFSPTRATHRSDTTEEARCTPACGPAIFPAIAENNHKILTPARRFRAMIPTSRVAPQAVA